MYVQARVQHPVIIYSLTPQDRIQSILWSCGYKSAHTFNNHPPPWQLQQYGNSGSGPDLNSLLCLKYYACYILFRRRLFIAHGGGGGSTVHYNMTRVRSPPLRRADRVIERNVPYTLLLLSLLFPATVKSNFTFIYVYLLQSSLAAGLGCVVCVNSYGRLYYLTHPTESARLISCRLTNGEYATAVVSNIFRNFFATTLSFLDVDGLASSRT